MHYQVVGVTPSTLSHAKTQGSLTGVLPVLEEGVLANPSVSAGLAEWKDLTDGGLFNFYKKSIVIESLSTGTWKIGRFKDNVFTELRTIPSVVPFKLCPGEALQFSGSQKCYCVARLDVRESL